LGQFVPWRPDHTQFGIDRAQIGIEVCGTGRGVVSGCFRSALKSPGRRIGLALNSTGRRLEVARAERRRCTPSESFTPRSIEYRGST
jgi:hypothetical protein